MRNKKGIMSSSTNPSALTGTNYRSVSATHDTSTFFKVLPSKKKKERRCLFATIYTHALQISGSSAMTRATGKEESASRESTN